MVRSFHIERLPYIDVHEVAVDADVDAAWRAVLRVVRASFGGADHAWLSHALRLEPARATGTWAPEPEPGAAVQGFEVGVARRAELLSLRGRHRFSRYRLDVEVAPDGDDRSLVRARTWAEFPGILGAAYRALVIGSGGHRLVVSRMMRRVAREGGR